MLSSTRTVWILLFIVLALVVLLILLYKKLNREASGEYTIQRMVCKEGGLRDRARGAAQALGRRLGVPPWPRRDAREVGEEMSEVLDEEAQARGAESHGSDSEDSDTEEEEEEDVDVEQCHSTSGATSDDSASLGGSEAGELSEPANRPGASGEAERGGERGERGEAEGGDGGDGSEGDSSKGPEFSSDPERFSRGATPSEDGQVTSDVTLL